MLFRSLTEQVIDALRLNDWNRVETLVNKPKAIKSYYNGFIKVVNGIVYYKNKKLDNDVTKKILLFMEQDLPYQSLVKFLARLMKNPDKRCREALYRFMELENIPINDDGMVVAYKSLRKTLKDWYSDTVQHKIGQTVYWGQRKKERKNTHIEYGNPCGTFFHIGTFEYAKGFNAPDNVVCLCEVDPACVKSVPDESSCGKIRVTKYRPIAFYDTNGNALPQNYYKTNKVN